MERTVRVDPLDHAASDDTASRSLDPERDWLPPRGVLVHIGPHKTATTALQSSLMQARPALAEQGVVYPGSGLNHARAAQGLLFGRYPEAWDKLVTDVARRQQRAMVSAEYFDHAEPEKIHTLVEKLGQDDVRILITLRKLDRVYPSMWQQSIRNGSAQDFDAFLRDRFRIQDSGTLRYPLNHADLIDRWAQSIGPEKITAMIVESGGRGILRDLEELLALAPNTLPQSSQSNRSLTIPEIELARAVNRLVSTIPDDELGQRIRKLRRATIQALVKRREPPRDEMSARLPRWATDAVSERQQACVDQLMDSGVSVVGDPATLLAPSALRTTSGEQEAAINTDDLAIPQQQIPSELAADVIVALLEHAGAKPAGATQPPSTLRRVRNRLAESVRRTSK